MTIDFQYASERCEGWLLFLRDIDRLGKRKRALDIVYGGLNQIWRQYNLLAGTLRDALPQLATLSDGQIDWGEDRGWPAVFQGGTLSVWSSAHEASVELALMAIVLFLDPVSSDEEPDVLNLFGGITDLDEQRARAAKLMADRHHAFKMTHREVAKLQERIRRERAKYLFGPASEPNDLYLPFESIPQAVKRFERPTISETTLKRWIKNGEIRCKRGPGERPKFRLLREDVLARGGKVD